MELSNDFRILVIDDNPSIHQDFLKILTGFKDSTQLDQLEHTLFDEHNDSNNTQTVILPNFTIDTATQGKEGVKKISKAIKDMQPYSIVFVDMRMPPGWDGIETIKRMSPLDPNAQFVICSAYSDYSWEETIQHLGLRDNLLIMKKPFDNVMVRQLACALTKKWQVMSELKKHEEHLENIIAQRTYSLNESLSLIRTTFESSIDGILVVNNEGKVIDFNSKFVELWNIPSQVMKKSSYNDVLNYISEKLKVSKNFNNTLKDNHEVKTESSCNKVFLKNGSVYEQFFMPQQLDDVTIGKFWRFRDITEKYKVEEKLKHQAFHDPLTGLANRVLLEDKITQAMTSATRYQVKLGVFFIDLDRFKIINDSLGHEVGDKLLVAVANRLQKKLRSKDILCRLGGDEFVVLIEDIKHDNTSYIVAKKIIDTFKQPFKIDQRNINVSLSLGISIFPDDGQDSVALLRHADMAMYHAKEEGKNNFQFYNKIMHDNSLKNLEIEDELRDAIEHNEFFLTYQAQHNAFTEKIIAAEVLIRWNHPQYGVISPIDFLPQAEASGLIVPIGEWVINTACKQCKAWHDQGLASISIAVNAASAQLRDPRFVQVIQTALKNSGLAAKYLAIEITENVMLSSQKIIEVTQKIRDLGVKVALDDFGTGNSSLNYLKKSSIDCLKIDKSFIDNKNELILIKFIIALAKGMQINVVAEGVETKIQLDFLKKEDCQNIQGYYFSQPIPNDKFEKMLAQNVDYCSKNNK